jgi:hypothetical protein
MGGARKVNTGACQRGEISEIFGQLQLVVCRESRFWDANSVETEGAAKLLVLVDLEALGGPFLFGWLKLTPNILAHEIMTSTW